MKHVPKREELQAKHKLRQLRHLRFLRGGLQLCTMYDPLLKGANVVVRQKGMVNVGPKKLQVSGHQTTVNFNCATVLVYPPFG